MPETLLSAEKLCRHFGGLIANRDVDLRLERGSIHALLGPNGAGKSTCINMLSGNLQPTSGRIVLKGRDVTALGAAARSQAGLGRSYQRTNIFPRFTVLENVRLAVQSRHQQAWRLLSRSQGQEAAEAVIESLGLASRCNTLAGTLSHGEQRILEIAMVLATDAEVLLLDEPLAGMGGQESAAMVALLQGLKAGRAILLVEHDMDAVFALADVITVMVGGEVLESGRPEAIRRSSAVQQAYLGQEDVLHE